MRRFGAVIAGLIAVFVIVVAVELLAPLLHPLPAGARPGDPVATGQWLMSAPLSAQAVVVLAWLLGALGGGWLALRISGWTAAAWIVALLDMAMAVLNLLQFTHPLWMQIGAVVAPLIGGWIAIRLAGRGGEPVGMADDPAI